MKHTVFLIALVALVSGFYGCENGEPETRNAESNGSYRGSNSALDSYVPEGETLFSDEGSYALGVVMGMDLMMGGIFPEMGEFIRGMQNMFRGESRHASPEEAFAVFQSAHMAIMERRNEINRGLEAEFLAENAARPGVTVTASGLQYEVLSRVGDGPRPTARDAVRVHYEGTLTDGTVFDSSIQRGVPVEFPLAHVIPGWTEGLQLMGVGDRFRFVIPSNLAYGSQGVPQAGIPAYAPLVFEVELLDIIHDDGHGQGWF